LVDAQSTLASLAPRTLRSISMHTTGPTKIHISTTSHGEHMTASRCSCLAVHQDQNWRCSTKYETVEGAIKTECRFCTFDILANGGLRFQSMLLSTGKSDY